MTALNFFEGDRSVKFSEAMEYISSGDKKSRFIRVYFSGANPNYIELNERELKKLIEWCQLQLITIKNGQF